MAINGSKNAAILAAQILAGSDQEIANKVKNFKNDLKEKIVKANEDLAKIKFEEYRFRRCVYLK